MHKSTNTHKKNSEFANRVFGVLGKLSRVRVVIRNNLLTDLVRQEAHEPSNVEDNKIQREPNYTENRKSTCQRLQASNVCQVNTQSERRENDKVIKPLSFIV